MSLGKKKIQHQAAAAAGITATDHFTPKAYAGGSAGQSVTVGFQPDLIIGKRRDSAENWWANDATRTGSLFPNLDLAEISFQYTTPTSTGFTVNGTGGVHNTGNLITYCFKGGGDSNTYNIDGTGYSTRSAAGLTSGTIADAKFLGCSTNTAAGFSVIKYNGSGASAGQTIDTGLTSDIELMIIKNVSTGNWVVVDSHTNKYHFLNTTATGVGITFTDYVDGTKPKLYDFSTFIHYCFHSVPGYSDIGTYLGTGATGNAITTGFEPRFLMIKSSSNAEPWFILDAVRDASNPRDNRLMVDSNAAEDDGSVHTVNFDSNGFTANGTIGNGTNGSGVTYLYLAIA
mgnify:CR=1 FL=1